MVVIILQWHSWSCVWPPLAGPSLSTRARTPAVPPRQLSIARPCPLSDGATALVEWLLWLSPSTLASDDGPARRGRSSRKGAGQIANVTAHPALCLPALCRRLPCPPDLSSHRHQPQIDRRSVCQFGLVRCGPVSAEESTSRIGSAEPRTPTRASPARSSSRLQGHAWSVTSLLVTSPPRPSSFRAEDMFHGGMGSG